MTDCFRMNGHDIFSIYYNCYGIDEIKAMKKQKSAKCLKKLLDNFGFTTDDNLKWLDNIDTKIDVIRYISDMIFNDLYEHKSKNTRLYYGKTMNLTIKKILINKIDRNILRNVYCILI